MKRGIVRVALLLFAGPALRPFTLFAQCPDGSAPPCTRTPARVSPLPAASSLSVLYLTVPSADTADRALADGITEEMIARLAQVDGLHVTSRYAAQRYRDRSQVDPKVVSRELGVRYVLTGTLRHSVGRIRVGVEVVDATTGYDVWARTYEQGASDVFGMEDSVAVQVAAAVRGRLTGKDRAYLIMPRPTNSEAYLAFLHGRAAIRGRTAQAAILAIADYRRALRLDPDYARAWAALAHVYMLISDWGWDIPGAPLDSTPVLAARAASRALALDSGCVEAWTGAGMAASVRDQRESLRYHRRAVALDSTNVEAMHQLAWAYQSVGDLDSAVAVERLVTARDPFFAYAYASTAEFLNTAGHPEDAIAAANAGLAADSTQGGLFREIGVADLALGRLGEAAVATRRALALGDGVGENRMVLALIALAGGDSASARAASAEMADTLRIEFARVGPTLSPYDVGYLAAVLERLGDTDSAFAWLARIHPGMRGMHRSLFRSALFRSLQGDQRFAALFGSSLR